MRIIMITASAVIAVVLIILNVFVMPQLLIYSESKIKSIAYLAVSDAIEKSFSLCDYDALYNVVNDDKSDISYVKSNALEINRISNMVSSLITEELQKGTEHGVSVNMGAAINAGFAGIGPAVTIDISPVGSVKTEFVSDFESGGVNQTRHRLYIKIYAEIYAALGLSGRSVTVDDTILISENIIIGPAPEYFVDVNNEEDMLNLLP